MSTYRVLRGISYPDPASPGKEKHAEPGETVSDVPAASIDWLVEAGAIELAGAADSRTTTTLRSKPEPAEPADEKE
jgi:hypothetical protein